jgi:hypothetical protein
MGRQFNCRPTLGYSQEGGTVKEKIAVVGSSMFFYLQEH